MTDDELRGEINRRERVVQRGMLLPELLPGRRGLNHDLLWRDTAVIPILLGAISELLTPGAKDFIRT